MNIIFPQNDHRPHILHTDATIIAFGSQRLPFEMDCVIYVAYNMWQQQGMMTASDIWVTGGMMTVTRMMTAATMMAAFYDDSNDDDSNDDDSKDDDSTR